jgi:adenosylcobinamide-GDP ribazoletransferase
VLPSLRGSVLAVVALVSSRQLLAWACARPVPPARADGLGAPVAGRVTPAGWALSTAVTVVLAAGVGLAADLSWWAGPVVLAAAVAGGALVLLRAVVRLGGITGDVLGAVVEVALAAGLTAAAVVLPHAV